MTNGEIILTAMMLAELDPMEVTVDTYAGWKRKGFVVKRGETAVFKTKIWKPSKYSKKEVEEIESRGVEVSDRTNQKLILVNAAFFTDKQVERA